MSFLVYDITFLIVFVLAIAILFYVRRKHFKWDGILLLYRTNFGVKLIDRISKKYKGTLGWMRYVVIAFGIALMVAMVYFLVQLLYLFIKYPAIVKAIKVPPLTPLIPYLPEIFHLSFLPPFYFTYWIIAIAIVAVFHEAAHGIFARYANINVKSTGFGFLGPFLAAFVEPDDKQMKKKSNLDQMAILGAGTFVNLLLTVIFFILLIGFFKIAFMPAGVVFTDYSYSIINSSQIEKINGVNASSIMNLSQFLENKEEVMITYNGSNYFTSRNVLLSINGTAIIKVYDNFPAFNVKLSGAINGINGVSIKDVSELETALLKLKPGNNITMRTTNGTNSFYYNLSLAKNPVNSSQAYLGIVREVRPSRGIAGKISNLISMFKQDGVYYSPRIDGDFNLFIYNLIWWIVIINLSVALINMLPLGIFDGGRFFYLMVYSTTKSKKFAEWSFKIATYINLLIFIILMVLWAFAFF